MKTAQLLLFLTIYLFSTACNDQKKEKPDRLPIEVEANPSKYIQKGSIIFGNKTMPSYYFLDAQSLSMQAVEANAFIDSLRLAYQTDSTDINTQFALGTYYSTSIAFKQKGELGGPHCDSALILLGKVIESSPNYKEGAALFNRAQAHFCQQDWQAGAADLEQYCKAIKAPSAYALLGLAHASYKQADQTKACQYFQEYKTATPGSGNSSENIWSERCQ